MGPTDRARAGARIGWRRGRALQLLRAVGLAGGLALAASQAAAAEPEPRTERPLPRFEGRRSDEGRAGTDLFRHRRGVVFAFAPNGKDSEAMAPLIAEIQARAKRANIALLGISQGSDSVGARRFADRHGLEFPVILDSDGAITRKLRLPARAAATLVVDAEGYMVFGFSGVDPELGPAPYRQALLEVLHLESESDELGPALGLLPAAPPFEVRDLEGATLALSALKGKVVVVVFFLATCPHCHDALRFLSRLARKLARDDLAIVSISVQGKRYVVEDMVARLGLTLPIYLDPDGAARDAYSHTGSVPDTLVLNRQHRIMARHSGMSPRLQALLTMEIRGALGGENQILMDRKSYSGEETCRICHAQQYATWSLTRHAYAFETLIEHGQDRNPECLPCHTVGWEEAGGYDPARRPGHLEGVQCENCHARGGPHQSTDPVKGGLETVCAGCHTTQHSLRFAFAERLPLVSHAANAKLTSLSLEERRALLEKRDRRKRQLFEVAEYVGAERCQGCHTKEHALWAASGHAQAFETLRTKSKHTESGCQKCHTTGFGEDGGFPSGADAQLGVGCESCHGPGGDHVASDPPPPGTILGLTDKCDSCVVLQICGACHDQENDPGFEFELLEKLERIRHGFRDREAAAR